MRSALENLFPGSVRTSFTPFVSDEIVKICGSVILVTFKPMTVGDYKLNLYINEREILKGYSFSVVEQTSPEFELVKEIGGVQTPRGLVFTDDGFLVVNDKSEKCIKVFNPLTGTLIKEFGAKGLGDGQLNDPLGMAIDGDNLYVADTKNNRIQIFSLSSGVFVKSFGKEGTLPGEMKKPRSIAINKEKKILFVTEGEESNSRVQVFDLDNHQHLRMFGHFGSKDAEFDWPASIVLDSDSGNLFIVDENNVRLCVYKQSGEYLNHMSQGEKGNTFGGIFGLAIDKYSRIYMAHQIRKKVLILTPSNKQLKCNKDFNMPLAISISREGLVAVSDLSKKDYVYLFKIKDY